MFVPGYYPEPITERAEKIKGYVAFCELEMCEKVCNANKCADKTKVDIKTE